MRKAFLYFLFFCSNILLASAQNNSLEEEAKTELIVQLKAHSSIEQLLMDFPQKSAYLEYKESLSTSMNIHLFASNNRSVLSRVLKQHPTVLFVQENAVIQWRNQPNDALYDSQWALDTIKAAQAWNYATGGLSPNGDTIVCAVVDGTFDVHHEDLVDNVWHNHAEIPNNQLDDDQNGFVDDYTGWQTVYDTDQHDYGSISNHGTQVAGIIGAKGDNGIGVAGINWDIKLMFLSAHTAVEITKLSNIIEAYSYIMDMRRLYNNSNGQAGAFVVSTNSSWGINNGKAVEHPIWCALYDSLGAVGILSAAATINSDKNIDFIGDMPCTCPSDYLLAVSESSNQDKQVAGYGKKSIDLFAPAASKSTRWSDNYGDFGGTSGASPHVAGAIALMYSYQNVGWSSMIQSNPQQAALLVKSILLNSVDKTSEFENSVSGGRLNLGRAMQQLAEYFSQPTNGELLLVYPSPVRATLTVKAALAHDGQHPLRIYNTMGQPVAVFYLENNAPTVRYFDVEVEHLARGMYVVELETDGKKYTRKFVKY